jgi:hypothetical protein
VFRTCDHRPLLDAGVSWPETGAIGVSGSTYRAPIAAQSPEMSPVQRLSGV